MHCLIRIEKIFEQSDLPSVRKGMGWVISYDTAALGSVHWVADKSSTLSMFIIFLALVYRCFSEFSCSCVYIYSWRHSRSKDQTEELLRPHVDCMFMVFIICHWTGKSVDSYCLQSISLCIMNIVYNECWMTKVSVEFVILNGENIDIIQIWSIGTTTY